MFCPLQGLNVLLPPRGTRFGTLAMSDQVTLCFQCLALLKWPKTSLCVSPRPGPGCNALQCKLLATFRDGSPWGSWGPRDDGSPNALPTSTLLLQKKPSQTPQRPESPGVWPCPADGSREDCESLPNTQVFKRPLPFWLSGFLPPSAPRASMSQKGGALSWQDPILLAGSFSGC